jgi:hypothetical protein
LSGHAKVRNVIKWVKKQGYDVSFFHLIRLIHTFININFTL